MIKYGDGSHFDEDAKDIEGFLNSKDFLKNGKLFKRNYWRNISGVLSCINYPSIDFNVSSARYIDIYKINERNVLLIIYNDFCMGKTRIYLAAEKESDILTLGC